MIRNEDLRCKNLEIQASIGDSTENVNFPVS